MTYLFSYKVDKKLSGNIEVDTKDVKVDNKRSPILLLMTISPSFYILKHSLIF